MAILKDHIKAGKNKQLRRSCIVNYSWALGSSNCLLLTCLQLPEFITFRLHCGPHSIQHLQPHWGKTWCIDCPTSQVQTKKIKRPHQIFLALTGPSSSASLALPWLIRNEFVWLQASWVHVLRFSTKVSEIQVISFQKKTARTIYSW